MTSARHGTNSRYHLGCRCFECRLAHSEYTIEYRNRRRQTKKPLPTDKFKAVREDSVKVERMIELAFKRA